ncbi:MAG: peptide deformylase [Myxococcota bacterium]
MAQLEILEYPDTRLRLPARPVTRFDEGLDRLIDDLVQTLHAKAAIGLCAPQVGVPLEILVMDLSGNASAPQVYVNPEIIADADPGLVEESCLSVPGVVTNVWRATRVRVRAQDRRGHIFQSDLEGMNAVCLQHEMDHFAGKLLVDRLNFFRRFRLNSAVKRAARRARDGHDAAVAR